MQPLCLLIHVAGVVTTLSVTTSALVLKAAFRGLAVMVAQHPCKVILFPPRLVATANAVQLSPSIVTNALVGKGRRIITSH